MSGYEICPPSTFLAFQIFRAGQYGFPEWTKCSSLCLKDWSKYPSVRMLGKESESKNENECLHLLFNSLPFFSLSTLFPPRKFLPCIFWELENQTLHLCVCLCQRTSWGAQIQRSSFQNLLFSHYPESPGTFKVLPSERRILQKHCLIIVGLLWLWSFCCLEMNILAWECCPLSLWGDTLSPRSYWCSLNWQNLSDVCDVKKVKTTMRRTALSWFAFTHWLWHKSPPPTPQPSLHGSLISIHFSKLTRRLRKKSQVFSPVSSVQYSQPGCNVDWSLSYQEKEELWTWLGPTFPFDRSIP